MNGTSLKNFISEDDLIFRSYFLLRYTPISRWRIDIGTINAIEINKFWMESLDKIIRLKIRRPMIPKINPINDWVFREEFFDIAVNWKYERANKSPIQNVTNMLINWASVNLLSYWIK